MLIIHCDYENAVQKSTFDSRISIKLSAAASESKYRRNDFFCFVSSINYRTIAASEMERSREQAKTTS